ncbi:flagellar motor protein MotB [Methylophilus medardicus]|uniref:Flagellar motor protein MotB n=1 Tax=Methylophilus medardicus TaxID=2588534 RepID=A0A5B8CSG4_9PROT|nr:flagellar motor protein MotB [Methylophilus medardicus]QDC44149.1 flagellar motor protein MotB [Methylophilus medardicus]QDC49156.1 flagellar motor protein MotB [Methylophilus medardicus]QDC52861.1 flagellar motor protein MotB [Methylophilus medardicus]
MAEEHIAPIIVKKIKKSGGGHHGGAWKIAYADFVTAMMAFFLLMWLLGSTSKAQKEGIAEYFQTPLHMVLMGPSMGQSDSALKNTGGKDVTKKQGQVKPVEGDPGKLKTVKLEDVKEALKQAEKVKLEALKAKIEQAIEDNPTLQQFKSQLKLDITSEGLRIQIIDEQNRPMFENAKAELQPYAKQILREIGKTLNGVDNKISLSGHTDAAGYANGEHGYSNWELSADRANASRRELINGGMDETKLMRVVGLGSAIMMDKENPFNPINRRISLIVMNKDTEEQLLKDNDQISVSEHDQSQVQALQKTPDKPAP